MGTRTAPALTTELAFQKPPPLPSLELLSLVILISVPVLQGPYP